MHHLSHFAFIVRFCKFRGFIILAFDVGPCPLQILLWRHAIGQLTDIINALIRYQILSQLLLLLQRVFLVPYGVLIPRHTPAKTRCIDCLIIHAH